MDNEWLNRVGILAEVLSFVLIAPELVGQDRAQRLEDRLETIAKRTRQSTQSARAEAFAGTIAWALILILIASYVLVVVSDNNVTIALLFTIVLIVGQTAFHGWGSIRERYEWNPKDRIDRILYWYDRIGVLTLMVLTQAAIAIPRLVSAGILALLAGDGRLRALIFASGVVFLFGGMAAQFVATF